MFGWLLRLFGYTTGGDEQLFQRKVSVLARTKSLVERFGGLPAGMSKADAEAVLQFLYGAFDRRTARQVKIAHPYLDTAEDTPPELTIVEFCCWLTAVAR